LEGAKTWEKIIKDWLAVRKEMPIHVVTYEDVQSDTWGQMEEMTKFLNSTLRTGNSWHACRDRFAKGNFHRPKALLPFRLFTSDMVEAIEQNITSVARLLSELIKEESISAGGLLRSFKTRNLPIDSLDFAFTKYTGQL
jgi:hypothetical protein